MGGGEGDSQAQPTYVSQPPVDPRLVRINDCYFKPLSI